MRRWRGRTCSTLDSSVSASTTSWCSWHGTGAHTPESCARHCKYELQDILDHDFKYGQWWFLVHWKGYSPIYESTWETRNSLVENAKSTLQCYEKKYGLQGSEQQSVEKPVSRPCRKRKAKRWLESWCASISIRHFVRHGKMSDFDCCLCLRVLLNVCCYAELIPRESRRGRSTLKGGHVMQESISPGKAQSSGRGCSKPRELTVVDCRLDHSQIEYTRGRPGSFGS